MSNADVERVAQGYDAVYTAIPKSHTFDLLWREHSLGKEYPDGFEHISFLTLAEMRGMAAEISLSAGELLVDLACGMGGPGLWIARETGARLIGVDISTVAISAATERARRVGLSTISTFNPGTFAETGVVGGAAAGVMTVDALQYAPDKQAALFEVARILRRGGRFVFACFAIAADRVRGVPIIGTDAIDDYRPLLKKVGLNVLHYEESADWNARVTRTYQSVIDAKTALVSEMGENAFLALFGEMSLTLQLKPYTSRILVTAEKL
jgi:ubiquinone/menaquinone biosynthesis C-methylase UbiE